MKFYIFFVIFLVVSCRNSQQTFFDIFYSNQNYEFEENIVNLFDFKTITECDSFINDFKKYDSFTLVFPFEDKFVTIKLESYTIWYFKEIYDMKVKLYPFDFQFFLPNNKNIIKYNDIVIEWYDIENMIFETYKDKKFNNIHFGLEENINPQQIQKLFHTIINGYHRALNYRSQKRYKTQFENLNHNQIKWIMDDRADLRIGKPYKKKIKPPEGFKKPIIPIKKD